MFQSKNIQTHKKMYEIAAQLGARRVHKSLGMKYSKTCRKDTEQNSSRRPANENAKMIQNGIRVFLARKQF